MRVVPLDYLVALEPFAPGVVRSVKYDKHRTARPYRYRNQLTERLKRFARSSRQASKGIHMSYVIFLVGAVVANETCGPC